MAGRSKGPSAPSHDELDDWFDALARSLPCQVVKGAARAKLTPTPGQKEEAPPFDGRTSISVAWRARTRDEWETRSEFVEHRAAKSAAEAPTAFRASLSSAKASGGEKLSVLRLAFGLSLDQFPYFRRRYTAYQVEPWRVAWLSAGGDRLFATALTDLQIEKSQSSSLERRFDSIRLQIQNALSEFAQMQSERVAQRLEKRLAFEVDQVNGLYFGDKIGSARLHGRSSRGLRGDAAIEAEHRQRLSLVHARSALEVKFELLSVAEIACLGRLHRDRQGMKIQLPFVSAQLPRN